MTVRAIYKGGVFQPLGAVDLRDGTQVELEIIVNPQLRPPGTDATEMAAFFAELATMPIAPDGLEFSNRDHDRILYGWEKKR
jgi:hypothetical protein